MQILTQVSYEMSIFLTFHEKVYLILTNLGEKLEFRTISKKSDRNPSNNEIKIFQANIEIENDPDFYLQVQNNCNSK